MANGEGKVAVILNGCTWKKEVNGALLNHINNLRKKLEKGGVVRKFFGTRKKNQSV